MKRDNEYIKELFDNDGIRAPGSLSEENVLKMLEAAEPVAASEDAESPDSLKSETGKTGKTAEAMTSDSIGSVKNKTAFKERRTLRPAFRRAIAVAAVAVIAVFGISGLAAMMRKAPDTSEVNGELYTFKSESEIEKTLRSMEGSSGRRFLRFGNSGDLKLREYSTATEEAAETESDADFESYDTGVRSNTKTQNAAGDAAAGSESH